MGAPSTGPLTPVTLRQLAAELTAVIDDAESRNEIDPADRHPAGRL
ncbi:hypothetical protein [Micromonospora sp. NPDC049301]